MLTEPREYYKPFDYPKFFDYFLKQNQIHWIPQEIALGDDVKDWSQKMDKKEQHLITQIFRFFTQADADIQESYVTKYIHMFPKPEIRMMLTAFANMESVHMNAYSLLLDTIGMPEVEYQAFYEYEEMREKHDYLKNFNINNKHEMAKSMAIISGGVEGVQLFSSFVILLNFTRFNKMKGMGQIITWSIRDESLHVEALSELFKMFIKENRRIWKDELKRDIYLAFKEIVKQEDKFIDLCFEMGGVKGLEAEEVKEYIRYIADRRLIGLSLKGIFGVSKNNLGWLDYILNSPEFTNFFENTATEYSKGTSSGSWDSVWNVFDKMKE